MLFQPTVLTTVAKLIGETLQGEYAVDPMPLFERVGLDTAKLTVSDARFPRTKMLELCDLAAEACSDPCIGVVVGLKTRPTTYYSLGFSFLTSHTLLDALHRFCRYHSIIATVPLKIELKTKANEYRLVVEFPDPEYPAHDIAVDTILASIIQLCRVATTKSFHPVAVSLARPAAGNAKRYSETFGAPVYFSADQIALHFDKAVLEAHLQGDNVAVAQANDEVANAYLQSLNVDKVSHEVRKLLIQMIPSGNVDKRLVARRLNLSGSTLDRRLHEEGFAFREILDDTRRTLAEGYIEEGEFSLAQITYLLGFSDQSNFGRAFKRWTGKSPSEYRGKR
jgi:AraC-like DNA-binding protein